MNIEFFLVDITQQDIEKIGLVDNITKTKDLQTVRRYILNTSKTADVFIDGSFNRKIKNIASLDMFERIISHLH